MTRPRLLAIGVVLLVPTRLAAQDAADVAWRAGNQAVAESLYTVRLEADSLDEVALHRLALMNAWSERYAESLALMERLIRIAPYNTDARIDRARILAWRGDLTEAMNQLEVILEEYPDNLRALQAQAQFAGWAGETDRALAAYDRIIEITPDDHSVRQNQAQVLTWASRNDEAMAIYDSLLAEDPEDQGALLGLAQLLSWSGELDSASAIYRSILDRDPRNLEAMQGEARTVTWAGDLIEGEARWRRTLDVDPNNVTTMVGLAQTLRWQGRHAAALEVLQEALALSPNDRDVLTQLRWTESVVRARASTGVTHESDSDGNRVMTTTIRTTWRPEPRLQVSIDAYRRTGAVDAFAESGPWSGGAVVTLWTQFEPGWSFSAGLGAGGIHRAAGGTMVLTTEIASPSRNRVSGALKFSRSAFDYTQELIEGNVNMDNIDANATARVTSTVTAGADIGYAVFHGSLTNQRWNLSANVTRRMHPQWTLGIIARTFGFSEDAPDGYFDPSYYGLAEVLARWNRTLEKVNLEVEAAPGAQQVRSAALHLTIRAAARATYTIAPGRDLSLRLAYSSAGLQTITTGTSDYRYYAVAFSASWLF